MTLLLSLFFISLISLTIMFGRKLFLLKNEGINILEKEHVALEVPYIAEIKHLTIRKIKRYGYVGLVTTVRLYFRSSNLLKSKYSELKTKIKNIHQTKIKNNIDKKEISGFLKMISDYKNKIRKIKHQIKEEEKMM